MKLVHFKRKSFLGYQSRLGIYFNESTIIDVNLVWQKNFELKNNYDAIKRAAHFAPSSLSHWLELYQGESLHKLQETFDLFEKYSKEGMLKTQNHGDLSFDVRDLKEELKFGPPLDQIKSYRDFYAHEKHVKAGFEKRGEKIPEAWYEMPVYYKGGVSGFIGHLETIPWPRFSQKLDYELELGVVIGKDGKNISAKNAYKHLFGFTILNDISARDIQKKEMSVRLGPAKGKDWCSIMGPVIITSDEFDFKDPDLLMTATINQKEWSRGRSSQAKYSWGEMLQHLSNEEWVRAGDFLGSGTVGTGCGLELDQFLKPNDKIELFIEQIGTLTNWVGVPEKI